MINPPFWAALAVATIALCGASVNGQDYYDYDFGQPSSAPFKDQVVIQPNVPYTPEFELLSGDTHEHYVNISFDGEPSFDVNFVLDVWSGDADLLVIGPVATPDGYPIEELPWVNVRNNPLTLLAERCIV